MSQHEVTSGVTQTEEAELQSIVEHQLICSNRTAETPMILSWQSLAGEDLVIMGTFRCRCCECPGSLALAREHVPARHT